jgi:maltooligosyltrehalose trehalohydrolase
VVYNHVGPDGNYTGAYSESYVDPSEETPWGPAINFGGEHSAHVRRFYGENLLHWVHEYHIDGFRFDATHAIIDRGPAHILAELSAAVEAHPRIAERPYLIAESHENDVRYLRPRDQGGFAFDGVWTDDFHHAVRTLLARDREGYYADFSGTLDDLAATINQGFLFEGDRESAILGMRGTRARDVPWDSFVYCLQNHDQVGNRAFGDRLSATASHADFRAASLLLLLLPQVPLLFQGQEFLAATPFQYFTDHNEELGRAVTEGRRREFAAWGAFSDPALRQAIPDPQDPRTFQRSKLNWDEASAGVGRLALDYHRELLRLRREDPVLKAYRAERRALAARVVGGALLVALEHDGARRWLVVNFGEDTELAVAEFVGAEVVASSDDPRWGGMGWPVTVGQTTSLPAHSAAFLGLQ